MQIKWIELRDAATTIAMLAIKLTADNEMEAAFIRRNGFDVEKDCVCNLLYIEPFGMKMEYDPVAWGYHDRTYKVSHEWLIEHWDEVQSGDVVDVEFILGERTTKKIPEIYDPLPF